MQVDAQVLGVLLQLQQLDIKIHQLQKQLEALPQRKTILEVRSKKKQIEQKNEQIDAMHATAEAQCNVLSDEDAVLSAKQKRIQEEIDSVKGDYRSVESRTKELNGVAKRKATLEAEISAALDELAKIEAVQAQVAQALESLNAQEAKATEGFIEAGGKIKQAIAQKEAARNVLVAELPDDVHDLYEKTAQRMGGVAVARLQDSMCGTCRRPIEHGRLVDLKRQGNLVTCPHCHRMLILA